MVPRVNEEANSGFYTLDSCFPLLSQRLCQDDIPWSYRNSVSESDIDIIVFSQDGPGWTATWETGEAALREKEPRVKRTANSYECTSLAGPGWALSHFVSFNSLKSFWGSSGLSTLQIRELRFIEGRSTFMKSFSWRHPTTGFCFF